MDVLLSMSALTENLIYTGIFLYRSVTATVFSGACLHGCIALRVSAVLVGDIVCTGKLLCNCYKSVTATGYFLVKGGVYLLGQMV